MMRAEKTSKKGMPILLVVCITVFAFLFLIVPLNLHDSNKRVSSPGKDSVEVIMAKRALTAGTVITLDDIKEENLSEDELPQGSLVGSARVIGRVLARPVIEGQVLTKACLVPEGTASILASQIPEGMRVFSVPITSTARPDHILLYPGCVVDVLVAYKLNRNAKGEALSSTMFRGLRVLAISGGSVISKPGAEEDDNNKKSSRRDGLLVSLLVEPRQVEALQLAAKNGSITMSLRNPLDKTVFKSEGSVLNRGTFIDDKIDNWKERPLPDFRIGPPYKDDILHELQKAVVPNFKPHKSKWEVTVINGRSIQKQSLE